MESTDRLAPSDGTEPGPSKAVDQAPKVGDPGPSSSSAPDSILIHQPVGQARGKEVVSKKPTVQIREPPRPLRPPQKPSYYSGYTVVKVEEKHGPLYNAIPTMPLPLAVLCCILNILAPGVGTLLAAPSVFCCGPTRTGRPLVAFGLNLVSAFLQMLTFLVIVGWIWSILWGMTFVTLAMGSRSKAKKLSSPVPYYVRRQSSIE